MNINKQLLLNALNTVKDGLASKEMIQQSTSFCFLKNSIVTFNDEISINCPIEINIEGAVNASQLIAYVSKCKHEEIDISIQEGEVIFKTGKSKAGFTLIPEILLPLNELDMTSKKWKSIPDNFCKGLSFTMGACGRDLTKPILTCIHINKNILEGSDSFKLVNFKLASELEIEEILLPASACSTIINFKPIKIAEGKGWLHFKNDQKAVLSCRTFADKYPNTADIIKCKGSKVLFSNELFHIIEKAAVFSKKDYILDELIEINLSENIMIVTSKSESGWFKEKVRVQYKGEPVIFLIPPYLLKDILKETNEAILDKNKLLFVGADWEYLTLLKRT